MQDALVESRSLHLTESESVTTCGNKRARRKSSSYFGTTNKYKHINGNGIAG